MTQETTALLESGSKRQRSDAILTALAQANQVLFRPGELEARLPDVLAILGQAAGFSRVYLYQNETAPGQQIIRLRSLWAVQGAITPEEIARFQVFDLTLFNAANVARLQAGKPVYGRLSDFPANSQNILKKLNVLSAAVMPIFVGDKWWGLLGVDSRTEERIWSKAEIEALKNVSASLGAAIENDRLYTAEKNARQRAELLHHVAGIISASLDREEVLQRSLDQLGQVLSFDSAAIYLLPQGQQPPTLVVNGHKNPSLTVAAGLQSLADFPILRQMQADRAPILSGDVRQMNEWVWLEGAENVRSFMAAPLLVQGQMIGALMVDSSHLHFYDESDLQIVSGLAQTVAVAVQNANLYTETRQRAEELRILHQVGLTAATAVTVDELLTHATEIISQTLYPDHFGFLLLHKSGDFLLPHPSYHPPPSDSPVPAPLAGSIIGRVVRTGDLVIVPDVSQDPDYFERRRATRSEIVVPVRIGDDVIGVINVESAHLDAFNQRDARFLTTLSRLVASFIERVQLHQTLRQQADSLADEVKRQTAELRQEKERLQTILDSAGEGIILTDKEGIVQYANPAVTRLTGFSQQEILGHKSNLWRSNKTPPETHQDLWQTILRGDIWHGELINQTKQGTHYDANLTVAPFHNGQGEMIGFVGIQSDISRLKNMERLKSRFVTDVSHELRTPVTNLKLYTDLLMRTPPERHGRYFEVLHIQVSRLEQLIEDILTLSRLEVNRLNMELHPVDINLIARQTVDSVQSQAAAGLSATTELSLEFIPTPAVEPVCGDPGLLRQLISNLVQNAVNYTPEGKILVATLARPKSGFVELVVQDTGVGIDPEERPYIFDRFFRGKYASHSHISGSGLGLTIVREIVDMLDGHIEIESAPGAGAKVSVMLKTAAASRLCS